MKLNGKLDRKWVKRRAYPVGIGFAWLIGLLLVLPVGAVTTEITAPILPDGFVQKLAVGNLARPTDMVLLPSGDMLVAQKGAGSGVAGVAAVRYVRQGALQATPVITLSANVEGDSGILAITADPDFADNGFFYLWYAPGESALAWQGTPSNRLSRFTFDPARGTADPASEQLLIDEVAWHPMHNGGSLLFDDAGNLLISTGDAGSPMGAKSNLAQQLGSLNGKVLRIRPLAAGGYEIPADNPFVGMTGDGVPRPEIYAWGLRNPFRMTKRPSDGAIYVLDVGQVTWEEINLLAPGANYGWPVREGPCPLHLRTDCPPAPADYTDPILSYLHPEQGGSGITAAAFYAGTSFPPAYQNRLFYADFDGRWLAMADPDDAAESQTRVADDIDLITDLEAVEGGLYLVSVWGGRIFYLYYNSDANQPPAVQLRADPVQGRSPLTVTFSAEGTRDPDDLVLSYAWDFGQGGGPVTTTAQTVSHLYPVDGAYTMTLTVRDLRGAAADPVSLPIAVFSGALPKIDWQNLTEPGRSLYQGGDQFRFAAVRRGGVDGLDATTPYLWTVRQHHNDHNHVILADEASGGITLTLPLDGHAQETNIWYEVVLHMLGDQGQRLEFTHALQPDVSEIWVESLPAWPAAPFRLEGAAIAEDQGMAVIAGQSYLLEAPPTLLAGEMVGEFDYWLVHDGLPVDTDPTPTRIDERRATIRPAATPQTYVAHYRLVRPANRLRLPYLPGAQPPVVPPTAPPAAPPGSAP
jgi:glucose/arabinose dehydrogenase